MTLILTPEEQKAISALSRTTNQLPELLSEGIDLGVVIYNLLNRIAAISVGEIDGDKLNVLFTPDNYTRTVVAPAENVEDLTAHLKGIDLKLLSVIAASSFKTGSVVNTSFSGNPKVAAIAFSAAYPDANYEITTSVITTSGASFSESIENKTAAGFTINMNANNITGLVAAEWHTIKL